jgi:hypothetical protein
LPQQCGPRWRTDVRPEVIDQRRLLRKAPFFFVLMLKRKSPGAVWLPGLLL